MTADFWTTITLTGTDEQVLGMANLLKEREKAGQGEYFTGFFHATIEKPLPLFYKFTDEEILALRDENGTIVLCASGPYGAFGTLEEVQLMYDLSKAANGGKFSLYIDGGTSYTTEWLDVSFEDGILSGSAYMCDTEEEDASYVEYLEEKIEYKTFLDAFSLTEDDLSEKDYEDMMYDCFSFGLSEVDYDEIGDYIETLTKKAFKKGIETLKSFKLLEKDEYLEENPPGSTVDIRERI